MGGGGGGGVRKICVVSPFGVGPDESSSSGLGLGARVAGGISPPPPPTQPPRV